MADDKKRTLLFSRIASREDALRMIRESSIGFFIVAAIQGGIGVFIAPDMLLDAAFFAVLAVTLMKWRSRIAAASLFLLSAMAFIVTILNRMGIMAEGGTNILLATAVLWVSVRAIEAAFKLRGRFYSP